MSRSSGERAVDASRTTAPGRAQVEPLAALAAVFAVVAGLSIYAGALDGAVPPEREPRLAPTAVDSVADAASDPTGVVVPSRLIGAQNATPAGRRLNATLTAAGERWAVGPPIPDGATDRAARRVGVRADDGVALGRLRVVVW